MPRGGRRVGAGGQFKWKHGKTKTIRVPEAIAEKVLEYARKLDDDLLEEDVFTLPVAASVTVEVKESAKVESSCIIEHVTQSKVINLAGITVRSFRDGSGVYLRDLLKAGFEIKPDALAISVKRSLEKDGSAALKRDIEDAINSL